VSQSITKPIESEPRTGRSLWGDAVVRIRRDIPAVICLLIIIIYAAIAISAGFVYSDWDTSFDYGNINQPPSSQDLLGTDKFGKSVVAKTMLGAKVSMTIGFVANIIAIPLGVILGAIAGYYGGFIDDIVVWFYTTLASIPGLIRVIAIKFAFEGTVFFKNTWAELDMSGMAGICIALAITGWISTCRYVRAEVMKVRELDYVTAARAIGTPNLTILGRHVLPNIMHIGIITFSLGFVGAVTAEVALSYLNIGVTNMPSWGRMIAEAQQDIIVGRWWQLAAASVAMFVLVLALNIFGDRLRDALDPKLRNV
jgi:ABC-type dipeptide/oligopeptide/nickel transport system permease subunit